MITVTRTGAGWTTCTSGSATYTFVTNVASVRVPEASTGSVVAASIISTCCLGPVMVTRSGSTSTLAICFSFDEISGHACMNLDLAREASIKTEMHLAWHDLHHMQVALVPNLLRG